MSDKKASWDNIPSLEGFEVDWEYKPKNPLGKRAHQRMKDTELYSILSVSTIPVKVAASDFEEKGYMVDISPSGIAVTLDTMLFKDRALMVGLFLGQQKIVSKAVVKHVQKIDGKYKTGMVFVNLNSEYADFITGLFASKISEF